MFDELFEMFERDGNDRRRDATTPRQGGIRGFFSRLFGGDDGAGDERSGRYDRPRERERYDSDWDDDDDDGRSPRQRRDGRSRSYRDDSFDFDD